MATMISEVYDALRSVGVGEDKARKAAEAMATYDPRFARLEADMLLVKWMLGAVLALCIAILGRLLFMH